MLLLAVNLPMSDQNIPANSAIVTPHPERLEVSKLSIRRDGASQFHVIADFDNTLTRAYVNGEKAPSIIGQLRKGKYLTPDYPAAAQALFDHYAPIERDNTLSLAERNLDMLTWWQKHFALLEQSGFNRDVINDVVLNSTLQFRDQVKEFIDLLEKHQIPLIIMSAAPGDMLIEHLRHEGLLRNNVHVIANLYQFDAEGNAVKINEPIIHSLNKHEVVVKNFPVFETIKERKNILLLGDSMGDVGMADGFDYKEIIKVGFLNQEVEKNIEIYSDSYDVVVTNDGSLAVVNEILEEMLE